MTDSNGHFQFMLPTGDFSLSAEKPGFFNPEQMGSMSEPRPVVSLTDNVADVLLKLVPQAVITGRATSIAGEPIEDFPIRLHVRRIVEGRAEWQAAGVTQTDEDGQFRISELKPGQYCLSAGPENARVAAPRAHLRGYAKVFFPNAPDFASASIIDLVAGQQFEADFALNQAPLYEISGQVVGAPPETGVAPTLLDSAGEQLNLLRFRDMQRFFAYVPAGKYTLQFHSQMGEQQLSATLPLTVAGNTPGIQAVLGPETAIPVSIRSESSSVEPRSPLTVQATVEMRPLADSLDQNQYSSPPATPGSATSYIRGVPPGTYSVEIRTFGGMYVQSATSGSIDVLREPLVVSPGARVDPIDVVLRDDGGQLSGSFQEQRLGTVILMPERGPASDLHTQMVSGSFVFDQLRPGDYLVLAFDRQEGLEYKNPDALAPYLSKATHVTIGPRQEAKVNLELIHLGR